MPRKKPKTAAELLAELEGDPAYQQRRAEQDARASASALEVAADERLLIRELGAVGVRVRTVYDFMNEVVTPPEIVPILLSHLALPHLAAVREGIIRALAYSHLREQALEPLRQRFRDAPDRSERWLLANSLAAMASLTELEDLAGIKEYAGLFE